MIATEIPVESIGAQLKEARRAKNLSLEQLAKLTKIKLGNLEAMEEDRFDQIPAPTYAKGFLKIVARLLELDEREILLHFESLYPQKSKQVIFFSENPVARKSRPWRIPKKGWVWVGVGAAVIAGLLLFSSGKEARKAANEETSKPELEVKGTPMADAGVKPVASPTLPALSVKVRAQSEVWMRVLTDDKLVFESTIPKDKEEEWAAQGKLQIRIGRPADVTLSVNGKTYDFKKEKKPVNLLVTPQEVKVYD